MDIGGCFESEAGVASAGKPEWIAGWERDAALNSSESSGVD